MKRNLRIRAKHRREILDGLGWCDTTELKSKPLLSVWNGFLRAMYRTTGLTCIAKVTGYSERSLHNDMLDADIPLRKRGGSVYRRHHVYLDGERMTVNGLAAAIGRSYTYVYTRVRKGQRHWGAVK